MKIPTISAKNLWTSSEEPPPLPLFQCCYNDVDFSFSIFFEPVTLGRGKMGKIIPFPVFLFEVVGTHTLFHFNNLVSYRCLPCFLLYVLFI